MIDLKDIRRLSNSIAKNFTDYLTDDEVDSLSSQISEVFISHILHDFVMQKSDIERQMVGVLSEIQQMESLLKSENVEDNAPMEITTYSGFLEWRNGLRIKLDNTICDYRSMKFHLAKLNASINALTKKKVSQL